MTRRIAFFGVFIKRLANNNSITTKREKSASKHLGQKVNQLIIKKFWVTLMPIHSYKFV